MTRRDATDWFAHIGLSTEGDLSTQNDGLTLIDRVDLRLDMGANGDGMGWAFGPWAAMFGILKVLHQCYREMEFPSPKF